MAADTYTLECMCGGFSAVFSTLQEAWQRGKKHAAKAHGPAFCLQVVRVKRGL